MIPLWYYNILELDFIEIKTVYFCYISSLIIDISNINIVTYNFKKHTLH